MIKGTCPVCNRVFKVADRYAGQTGRCKSCGAVVTVPGEPDEGLDGLPGVPPGADMAPAAASKDREGEAPAEPRHPATDGGSAGASLSQPRPATESGSAGASPSQSRPVVEDGSAGASPSQEATAPLASPSVEPAPPVRVLDEPTATHDARSRFEPDHGPTAMEGTWLKGEPGAAAAGGESDGDSFHADDVLASKRIVTTVESASGGRPAIIVLACTVLGLAGLGYTARFATGGPLGIALAAIGLGLAALGVVRLWAGHWDGVVLAVLFSLCDISIVLLIVYSKTPDGGAVGFTREALVFLGGGALALIAVLLAAVLPSSRAHLGSNR